MNKILFVYDPVLSVKNRQFTVRLTAGLKGQDGWILQSPPGNYYAKDLARVASLAADKVLLKTALDSEMALRRIEARFHSNEVEYTYLRIQPPFLQPFIFGCQQKQILALEDGALSGFEVHRNVLPELCVAGDRFDLLVMGTSLSEKDYLITTPPVTAVFGNRIVQLKENIFHPFLSSIPVQERLTEARRESLLMEYSLVPEKISIISDKPKHPKYNLPGDERAILAFNETLKKAKLIFSYGEVEIKERDDRQVVYDASVNSRVIRDFEKENRFRERLVATGFFLRPREEYNWFLSSRSLASILPDLQEAGFHVMVNHRELTCGAALGWKISADKAYISAKASMMTGEFRQSPEALFEAFRTNRLYYEQPDGSYGLISDEIRALLSGLASLGTFGRNGLRFHRRDFARIGEKFANEARVEIDASYGELLNFARNFDGIRQYDVPETLGPVLRPYQVLGYNWLSTLNHLGFHGILADDMGLGKTLQVLCLIASLKIQHKLAGTVLLIVPKTLLFNWELEIEKFTPELSFYIYAGPERSKDRDFLNHHDVVLTSYGLVRTEEDFFQTITWGYVILDEANAIKNPQAAIARAVKSLDCKNRLAITGTPVENSPLDLWSLFDFLMPGFLYGFKKFKAKYGGGREALAELHIKTRPYILRRLKKDVLKELPPKTEVSIFCDFAARQKAAYDRALQEAREEILAAPEAKAVEILRLLTKLRQIACHPALVLKTEEDLESGKTEAIFHAAESILSEGHKILIFSQFTGHLKQMETVFYQAGLKTFYLDGQTRNRAGVVHAFRSFKGPASFFISLKTGGTGLNLPEASYVFLLDPWWNPAVENQAIDRCHRIGQKQPVTVYRFITRGSIEEKVMALKQVKKQMEEALIQESDVDYVPLDAGTLRDLVVSG
jgi:superfamily II DNA or RNA helicase